MSTELARKLRRIPTAPERQMWAILHTFRREGFNFRRQVRLGTYYVDFACHQPALVIEVDGDSHAVGATQSNDATRDDYLYGRGYRVLRFWNTEVVENPEGVFEVIASALAERTKQPGPSTLDPSPQRGRESTEGPVRAPSAMPHAEELPQ